ncbi:MAG: hypothetical protein NTX03_10010 [Bacteroidetes bacterium]|nr:hypothetical protein [Bacteroidota bacterium]
MKKIICILAILLATGLTMPQTLHAQNYKINLCGKSGTISKATLDSLIKADCSILNIENGDGAYITKYRYVFVPKGGGRQMINQKMSGNKIPLSLLYDLKTGNSKDRILISDISIKKGKTSTLPSTKFEGSFVLTIE